MTYYAEISFFNKSLLKKDKKVKIFFFYLTEKVGYLGLEFVCLFYLSKNLFRINGSQKPHSFFRVCVFRRKYVKLH